MASCSVASIPSQAQPDCSWAVSPPANQKPLCIRTFRVLATLARADAAGNTSVIHRHVTNRAVARQIIAYGHSLRNQGLTDLHIVPSFTIDILSNGLVGAEFALSGKTQNNNIHEPCTLYFTHRHGRYVVVAHDPGQAW